MAQDVKNFSSSIDLGTGFTAKAQMNGRFDEKLINYNKHGVLGTELQVYFNEFVFASKSTTSENGYGVVVFSDCPVIKLHFSLSGNYRHYSEDTGDLVVDIPEGFCNMFFSPLIYSKDKFMGKRNRTLEVYLTRRVLEQIVGNKIVRNSFHKNTLLKPFVYFKESKQIPLKIKNQINEILNCTYKGALKEKYLKSRLTVLIIDFLIDKAQPTVDKDLVLEEDYLTIIKLEAYCRQNLNKKLTIRSLSKIAGFNTTKLKADFKKVYKTTIFKHITQLRMEKARALIVDENFTITQASYEVGYSSPQHFTVAFKKSMGYLPSRLLSGTKQ